MTLSEFYNEVARQVDTDGTAINVAETKRVLTVAFRSLAQMDAVACHELVAKAMASANKKK